MDDARAAHRFGWDGSSNRLTQEEFVVHYKNGRPAKNGDKVIIVDGYQAGSVGMLYDATAGNNHCNGKLAPISPNNPTPNLAECLHLDDVLAVAKTVPAPNAGG